MRRQIQPHRLHIVLALTLCIAGCATTGRRADAKNSPTTAKPVKITLNASEDAKLGTVVRHVGEQSGGGIVLMQGLEWYDAGALAFENASLPAAAEKIAATFHGKTQAASGYYFLYPNGYEALEGVSLDAQLPDTLQAKMASLAFGAGTPLYSVLAVLSRTLGVTLVADNAIAESKCGEISLPELPLPAVLEAILKSARITNEAFEVVAGNNYAFIRGRNLPRAETLLMNETALTEAQRRVLDEPVSLELPYPQRSGDSIEIFSGASPLEDILASLSQQMGMRVTAEKALARLPVNPVVVNALPRATVMELLIRQWLVPRYGYTLEEDRMVLRASPES